MVSLWALFLLIEKTKTFAHDVGKWTKTKRLVLKKPNIYERMSNWGGVELVNSLLDYYSAARLLYDSDGKVVGSAGYLQDMLRTLARRLNFTMRMTASPDKKWGSRDPDNGTWNGLVGMLVGGTADVVSAGLSVSKQRAEFIDYRHGECNWKLKESLNSILSPHAVYPSCPTA